MSSVSNAPLRISIELTTCLYSVAFFGPIYSLMSLFVCCLEGQFTSLDLAMMDVGAGYFGRIHVATESLISVPFVRILTSLASQRAAYVPADRFIHTAAEGAINTGLPAVTANDDDFWGLDLLGGNFDLEDWGTFSRMSPNEPTAHIEPLL